MKTTPIASSALPGTSGIDPRTRTLLRRADILINRKLDGILHGEYQGLVPGHGSERGETRKYQPGDDVRHIDWNVTARLDDTYIRETIADRELSTWAAVDLSPSLDFGTAQRDKRELALLALTAIGFLTARTGNRFGAVLANGADLTVVPARSGRSHLLTLLHTAAALQTPKVPQARTDLAASLTRLGALHRRRGLAIVISDFLAPAGWQSALGQLSVRHETLAIEVLDPRELELPDVGLLTLVDPETGRRREVQTSSASLRARYSAAATQQRADIASAIRIGGADHLHLRTDRDWVDDLVRFVKLRRERASRLPRRTR